jgi:hypothetical protein
MLHCFTISLVYWFGSVFWLETTLTCLFYDDSVEEEAHEGAEVEALKNKAARRSA